MADRPDFNHMRPEIAIPLIGEIVWDLKQYLQGNGQPGICAVRGQELVTLRERIAVVETDSGSAETEKLRTRMGRVEDYVAETRGSRRTIAVAMSILGVVVAALGVTVAWLSYLTTLTVRRPGG
jgi:hypothetical protein